MEIDTPFCAHEEEINNTKPIKEVKLEEQISMDIPEQISLVEDKKQLITLDDAIKQGKKILLDCEKIVVDLYGEYFANRGFSYTAKEVIVNLEEYLQSLFLVACMDNRDLQEEEMRFIWAVLSHADIFAGTDSIEGTLLKAKGIIENNPHAILISVAVDKFYEKKATAGILSGIYGVYKLMCDLAQIATIKKEKLFASIIAFAKAQGVKL